MNLYESKTLREKRANLVELNKQCLADIKDDTTEARVKELEAQWDARDKEISSLTDRIARAEKQEAAEAEGAKPVAERRSGRMEAGSPKDTKEAAELRKAEYRLAFFDYLRHGKESLSGEQQILLRQGYKSTGEGAERRAMSTTVAAGGYTIPEGFYNELQDNLLAFGGARDGATILTTGSGNAIPIPTSDATSQKAQIIGEGSALTSPQDPTFGAVTLNAFMYRSLILVSLELLQDSAFNLESWIRGKLTEYVARGTNVHFTIGNGSTQPEGYMIAGSVGKTGAAAAAITYGELVDLEHSVDPAYRRMPGTRFKFADSTLKEIKKLVDSQSRPLWLPGMAVCEPDTILGYRYTINQDMSAMGASAKSIAFGDFSKFFIRDVSDVLMVRANELHIGNGQIGFYVFSRHDSVLVDAGTDPIKYYQGQSA